MAKIKIIKGRQVFDSRGNPTVEAEVFLENNISATAISPSGASTGAFEAHELRDQDKNKFLGKSVNIAVENINNKISDKLKGLDSDDQKKVDKALLDLDGSENKKNLGANATLAVSLANSKCSALSNAKRLSKGIKEKSANCILVKPNQIGTLSETLEVISMAKAADFNTIISHRSGDTEDTFIADLSSATMSSQIKTGSLARSERVAKYNRLLRIEEELGNQAKMARI